MIASSIEIDRPPEEVFDYLERFDRHHEWQEQIVATTIETEGPVRAGTRVTDLRTIPGGGMRPVSFVVTAHEPPRRTSFRVDEGPVRAAATFTVEPAGDGRSRVTLELDFEGHGLAGKALLPLVRREAARQVPQDQRRLKEALERR